MISESHQTVSKQALLPVLQALIKAYCLKHDIKTMTAFAALAVVDREAIAAIYKNPAFYTSWKVVVAIAVAADMPTPEIKRVLRPLWDEENRMRTTAHRMAVIEMSPDIAPERKENVKIRA